MMVDCDFPLAVMCAWTVVHSAGVTPAPMCFDALFRADFGFRPRFDFVMPSIVACAHLICKTIVDFRADAYQGGRTMGICKSEHYWITCDHPGCSAVDDGGPVLELT
jgi:hypothetical protein